MKRIIQSQGQRSWSSKVTEVKVKSTFLAIYQGIIIVLVLTVLTLSQWTVPPMVKVIQDQWPNWHFWSYFNMFCSYEPLVPKIGQGQSQSQVIQGQSSNWHFDHTSPYNDPLAHNVKVIQAQWHFNNISKCFARMVKGQGQSRSKINIDFLIIYQHVMYIWWRKKSSRSKVKIIRGQGQINWLWEADGYCWVYVTDTILYLKNCFKYNILIINVIFPVNYQCYILHINARKNKIPHRIESLFCMSYIH